MQRYPVSSRKINSVGWENNTLEVQFPNGDVYQYEGVSLSECKAFLNSPSLVSALSELEKVHPSHQV